jgi:hypothetical protein
MSDWPSGAWQPPGTAPPQGQPWGAPPPGWGAPAPYNAVPKTNGLAIGALIAGCAQFAFCGVGAIVAIVLGHIARGQIKRSNGAETGRGLATAGLVLGYVGIALTVVGTAAVLVVVFGFSDDIERYEMRDDARAFIRSAQLESIGLSAETRDADVLRATYFDRRGSSFDGDGEMYLADGTSIANATDADWERNGWRFEMHRETPAGDVYVCATVPAVVGDAVVVRNGQCLG